MLTHARRPALSLLTLFVLAWLALGAAGCPPREAAPDAQDAGAAPNQDAGARADAAPHDANVGHNGGGRDPLALDAGSKGITHYEAAPGSKAVEDVGPPAPTIYFTAGLKGWTEPCGCTLDILLGGIDRIGGYLDGARKLNPSLVLDAGDTLFDQPSLDPHRIPQERAKAELIGQSLAQMGVTSTTPGPNDFALGRIFYLDTIRNAGVEVLVANLKEKGGLPLGSAYKLHTLGNLKVGVIGVVQPELFANIDGLEVSDPTEATRAAAQELKKQGAQVIVAVVHGDLKTVKQLLRDVPALRFAIVGHNPRETDQVELVEPSGYTLEAYDQGRYIGALKLYSRPGLDELPGPWANARSSSESELERVDRRIAQVEEQISRIPPAPPGQEPAFLLNLRKQLDGLKAERQEAAHAQINIPPDRASFLYRSVPVEPGYPLLPALTQAREQYNARLKELSAANPDPIPPVPQGQAEYVGSERCGLCHVETLKLWKTTKHSHAVETLVKRDKLFDNNCIGCHVTGYRQPGGSVLGKLSYTTTVAGNTFTKNLEDVGCEVCHGPGSLHIASPISADNKPQHIQRKVADDLCRGCHSPEHSPRFNPDTYRPLILGPGHEAKP
jgi:hypothetical protein